MSETSAMERHLARTFHRMTVPARKAMRALSNYGELEKRSDLWFGRENFVARWNTIRNLCNREYVAVVIRSDAPNRRFIELTEKGKEMMAAVDAINDVGGLAVAQAWNEAFREAAE